MSTHKDLCGCEWELDGQIWICIKKCSKHKEPKKRREFRPKSECVRAGGKWD